MNQKGDTKLAVIFIALFLVIVAVPIVLSPSLTGFGYLSLEPEQQSIAKTIQSRGLSLITSYAIKAIPSQKEAVIIASVVAFIVLFVILWYIIYRTKRHSSEEDLNKHEEVKPEVIENGEQTMISEMEHTNGRALYDEELEKIEHELNRLH